MNKLIIIFVAVFALALSACNRDQLFEREQYKAVIALKSNSTNFFTQILDLNSKDVDANGFVKGSISANVGGSLPTTEKIVITITEDPSLLNKYNFYNYETDARKYLNFLPKSRYKIPEMKIIIPAGANAGHMDIWINANGLSPDSVYIIPFRVVSCSAYEMNPEKSTVFYRIERKNRWSYTSSNGNTLASPMYQQRGRFSASDDEYDRLITWLSDPSKQKPNHTQTYTTKNVYVVSNNELRVLSTNLAGVPTGENPAVYFPRWAMNIKVTNEKLEGTNKFKLEITPWREDHINGVQLIQIDDDKFEMENRFLNTYELETNDWGYRFHVFRLCYDYIPFGSTNGKKRRMWEELRIDYVEDVTQK